MTRTADDGTPRGEPVGSVRRNPGTEDAGSASAVATSLEEPLPVEAVRGNQTSRDAVLELELYVRSLAPGGSHEYLDTVVARAVDLEDRGVIDGFTVDVWGSRVALEGPLATTDAANAVLERVERFRAWADRSGTSLESFFETREVASAFTEESYPTVTLPSVVLAEYEDDDLRFVAPCRDGGTVHSVDDRLTAIEQRAPDEVRDEV